MKKYKYIKAESIEDYEDWELIEIIPRTQNANSNYCMAIIMKEEKPMQKYPYLNEATNQELINELNKRLESQV